jgi:transposase InsO family protein
VRALMQWFAAFGISLVWVSDQGAHFKNEIMAKQASELHVTHRFSPAYTPRANGTVESVCKQVLRASRALLADFKLQPDLATSAPFDPIGAEQLSIRQVGWPHAHDGVHWSSSNRPLSFGFD